jgi:transcriptional regulator with AAA-type ATPase domain
MGEPLAQLNLGALLPSLAYGELFGALKGASVGLEEDRKGFFLENAGGVVFLDEIGDLNPDCQVQLLIYLDKGEVRPHDWGKDPLFCPCFVVAASNRPCGSGPGRDRSGSGGICWSGSTR